MSVLTPADTGDADLFALIGGERPSAPIIVPAHDDTSVDPTHDDTSVDPVLAFLASFASTSDKVLDADVPVSANGARHTTSDNPVLRQEKSESENGVLWRTAMLSTRARTTGRHRRKVLRFPALRRMYARARRGLNGGTLRSGKSYAKDIWTYLETWGYRTLNDLDGAGHPLPTADDLADVFYARIRERGVTFYPLHSNRGHGISTVVAEKMAQDAAHAVLRDWNPEWIRRQRERGAKGGRASKRPPTWNDADLDALAQLAGQTVKEQAAALVRSASTIDRMRRALRARETTDHHDTEEINMGHYTPSTTTAEWRSARKAEGGRKSRMPKTWGTAELDRLDGDLAGLTVAAQAEALGTSRSSVDRMRKALRARTADPS